MLYRLQKSSIINFTLTRYPLRSTKTKKLNDPVIQRSNTDTNFRIELIVLSNLEKALAPTHSKEAFAAALLPLFRETLILIC